MASEQAVALTPLGDPDMQAIVTKGLPDQASQERRANYFLSMVEDMTVDSAETFKLAGEELSKLKAAAKKMEDERVSWTGPLNAMVKRFNGMFQPHIKVLEDAEKIIKGKMLGYQQAEERRAAEERRIAEEAAEAERRRLAAEAAEIRRKQEAEAEAQRQAEEKRQAEARAAQERLEAAAKNAKSENERLETERLARIAREEEEHRQAEANRQAEQQREAAEQAAQAAEQTAAVIIAQPVAVAAPRAPGISTSNTVDFEVTSLLELATFIVMTRPDLLYLLKADEVKLRQQVKLQGMATQLPGVRVFNKQTMSAR